MRAIVFFCVFLAAPQLGFGALQETGQSPPDLNLLRQRIHTFWNLLKEGRRREALEVVDPPTQDVFLGRRELPFTSFAIRSLHSEDEFKTAVVTVGAVVLPPTFVRTVEWPVEETWLFREGNWYLHAEGSRVKELFGAKSAEDLTPLKVSPPRVVLDNSASQEILILNNTDREIRIKRVAASADFIQVDLNPDQTKIAPGTKGSVTIRWNAARVPADWQGGALEVELAEPAAIRIPLLRGTPF